VAGTKDTEGLLNEVLVTSLKSGVVVVNTVSIKVIDFSALLRRLEQRNLTFIRMHSRSLTEEQWNKLRTFRNMIVYPAITNLTKEANEAREKLFVRNVERFLAGQPENIVKA
jgi:phosphoglycerate dehydrogenase-like enzyme